jgi:poly-gamma-glutamate synthesis protein (capsule biosynthesis protein)
MKPENNNNSGATVQIAAVGDIMLGDHPVRFGNGVRSTIAKKGADFIFAEMSNVFKGKDIVFGNLEVAHSDIGLDASRLESAEFRGMPSSITHLKKAGFNVLSLCNNHSMEHGPAAFDETVGLVKNNGIFVSGLKTDKGYCEPFGLTKEGLKVSLLSYSLRPENYYKEGPVPYTFASEDRIIEETEHFRKDTDSLVVTLHWGEEYMQYPSPKQVLFARRLVDAGAGLILGHHAHVLQGIERYRNAVIVYNMGNFVFDMWQSYTRRTVIFNINISRKEGITVSMTPFYINDNFQPEPLAGKQANELLEYMTDLEKDIHDKYDKLNQLSCDKIDDMEKRYLALARNKMLRHRISDYIYFIGHLHQYKVDVIAQSFRRAFFRRFENLNRTSK